MRDNHTTHYACPEVIEKYGGKAVGCCCTGHECVWPEKDIDEVNKELQIEAEKAKEIAEEEGIHEEDLVDPEEINEMFGE